MRRRRESEFEIGDEPLVWDEGEGLDPGTVEDREQEAVGRSWKPRKWLPALAVGLLVLVNVVLLGRGTGDSPGKPRPSAQRRGADRHATALVVDPPREPSREDHPRHAPPRRHSSDVLRHRPLTTATKISSAAGGGKQEPAPEDMQGSAPRAAAPEPTSPAETTSSAPPPVPAPAPAPAPAAQPSSAVAAKPDGAKSEGVEFGFER